METQTKITRQYAYRANPMVARWYESHTWDGWATTAELMEHCIEWAGGKGGDQVTARRFGTWLSGIGAVSGRNCIGRYWAREPQASGPSTKPLDPNVRSIVDDEL